MFSSWRLLHRTQLFHTNPLFDAVTSSNNRVSLSGCGSSRAEPRLTACTPAQTRLPSPPSSLGFSALLAVTRRWSDSRGLKEPPH